MRYLGHPETFSRAQSGEKPPAGCPKSRFVPLFRRPRPFHVTKSCRAFVAATRSISLSGLTVLTVSFCGAHAANRGHGKTTAITLADSCGRRLDSRKMKPEASLPIG